VDGYSELGYWIQRGASAAKEGNINCAVLLVF